MALTPKKTGNEKVDYLFDLAFAMVRVTAHLQEESHIQQTRYTIDLLQQAAIDDGVNIDTYMDFLADWAARCQRKAARWSAIEAKHAEAANK